MVFYYSFIYLLIYLIVYVNSISKINLLFWYGNFRQCLGKYIIYLFIYSFFHLFIYMNTPQKAFYTLLLWQFQNIFRGQLFTYLIIYINNIQNIYVLFWYGNYRPCLGRYIICYLFIYSFTYFFIWILLRKNCVLCYCGNIRPFSWNNYLFIYCSGKLLSCVRVKTFELFSLLNRLKLDPQLSLQPITSVHKGTKLVYTDNKNFRRI
jgi:hypothetical protein